MPSASESAPLLPQPRTERPPPTSPPVLRPDSLNRRRPSSFNRTPSAAAANGTEHTENHNNNSYSDVLRDVIIGFADGLTVPFALTAGLSSLGSTRLVVMGGLAELFSGMISMGLGAYLAAATEAQHYAAEHARECWEVEHVPDVERTEVFDILARYGVSRAAAAPVVRELCADKEQWVRFMMDLELRLAEPDKGRAWISAATMGLSYFVGGLVPMIPYFVMDVARDALFVSIGITVVILLGFGYVKSYVTIRTRKAGLWGAMQTLVIGALAAGTSYAIVRLLDSGDSSS